MIVKDDSIGTVEWSFSIDSTNVRAHQHAAGAREKGGCATGWVESLAVVDEAIGRSRGGLTSKIHLATDGRGLPMSVILTPGQAGDNPPQRRRTLPRFTGHGLVVPVQILRNCNISFPILRAA